MFSLKEFVLQCWYEIGKSLSVCFCSARFPAWPSALLKVWLRFSLLTDCAWEPTVTPSVNWSERWSFLLMLMKRVGREMLWPRASKRTELWTSMLVLRKLLMLQPPCLEHTSLVCPKCNSLSESETMESLKTPWCFKLWTNAFRLLGSSLPPHSPGPLL